MDAYTGRQIGHYRILRRLGTGSFATVYLAEHLYIEKLAAIKILHIAMNEQNYQAFLGEARINARLEHPHIVRLLDFGFSEQKPYLVMEHAPNGTLRQLYPKGSRMPPQLMVHYVSQIAEALDYAHQQNVIHRDVKPENLLLNGKNELVLSDFGIAIVQQRQQSLPKQAIAGTPVYMAPEQFRGISLPASDQYALGVMVYEWLCGEPPFAGNLFALSYQHTQQPPDNLYRRLPDISPVIDDVILGALAKDPAQRFTNVRAFAAALAEAVFATQPSLKVATPDRSVQEKGIHTSSVPEQETHEYVMQAEIKPDGQQGLLANTPPRPAIAGIPLPGISPHSSQQGAQNQNRQRLIHRVYSFWITGVLAQSLEGGSLIELDLQELPDAVVNPWKQVVPTISRIPEKKKSILQLYTEADAELLILGAPGSGKTTVLLTLARDLLRLAEQNEGGPVPVIFNLSTWSNNQPLAAWLVGELESKYQVHHTLGQQLVKANLILPLLDGLDEVVTSERTACIETINRYRLESASSSLVVCSRSADYLAQGARMQLNKAVMIQPLSPLQANDYLAQAGDSLNTLRVTLQSETALRELTRTPLLLRMLALTYYNAPVSDSLRNSSSGEQIQQVLERYVDRMLERGSDKMGYSPQVTRHWLAWLARQLQQRNQNIFYIERMQPDCLEKRQTHRRYIHLMVGLIFSILGFFWLGSSGVNGVISASVDKHNNPMLIAGLILLIPASSLLLGLINGMLYQWQAEKVSGTSVRQKWRRRGQSVVRGLVNVLFMGLLSCVFLVNTPLMYRSADYSRLLILGILLSGMTNGLQLSMADWLLSIRTTEIQPAEIIVWSWSKMWRSFFKFLGLGLFYDFLLSLLCFGLAFLVYLWGGAMAHSPMIWVIAVIGIIIVVFFTLLFAVLRGLTGGLSTNVLDPRDIAIPNQGIRRSVRNSLLVGLVCLFFLMGIPALVAILFKAPVTSFIPLIMLIVLIMALRAGGIACIQHFVLRWLLRREGVMPWNYPRFLDYAAEHILLQKVGGGYMFVHRFLLEYFASLETNKQTKGGND